MLRPIPSAGLTFEDRDRLKEQVRAALVEALRPADGGVGDRRDLGSFAGHAFGVHAANVAAPNTSVASPSGPGSSPHGGDKGLRP
jgi:hypothetical protein